MSFLDLDVGVNREGGKYKWNECGVGEDKVEKGDQKTRSDTGIASWGQRPSSKHVSPGRVSP